ncbi:hypothetical protein JCM10914A_19190 [Paenibacillus sp. JCM 10914]|uniref:hypothetical protein n=1 Tax=Paenibacillus sp. JCM 10914 TaxID=1236974 RepID=UPI0003CC5C9B|nr:hypothetical protein [Paenibacillus sp. JCM 10914]GAE06202.1 hypothetical protein JCM10914_2349 [Paenibacillus sp. JCM 10914]
MKLMKSLLKISLTAVLVSTLTIVTTGVVVNAYIQSILASFNIQLETQMGVGGIMKSMFGMGNAPDTEANPPEGLDSKPLRDVTTEDEANSPQGAEEKSSPSEPPDDSLPVMGSVNTDDSEGASLEDQAIVMTPSDIVDRKGSLSLEDKEEIFTILMNKLPQTEMQKISEAMEDGLTAAELAEIEQGISNYLNPDEFDKLITMLKE